MGRLLKLIAQQQFEKDPDNIQERSKKLFKRFAQLSINVLAPPPPPTPKQQQQRRNAHHTKHRHTSNTRNTYRTVLVSVDAGKEEDLISDMRVALETLQHENSKLKNRVKVNEKLRWDMQWMLTCGYMDRQCKKAIVVLRKLSKRPKIWKMTCHP